MRPYTSNWNFLKSISVLSIPMSPNSVWIFPSGNFDDYPFPTRWSYTMASFNIQSVYTNAQSLKMFSAVSSNQLLVIVSGITTISRHSRLEYCSLFQDFRSTWTRWLRKTLLTCLVTTSSASSLWKFSVNSERSLLILFKSSLKLSCKARVSLIISSLISFLLLISTLNSYLFNQSNKLELLTTLYFLQKSTKHPHAHSLKVTHWCTVHTLVYLHAPTDYSRHLS